MIRLRFHIADVDCRGQLHFFEFDDALFFAVFLFSFFLVEKIFSVIDNLAHGGNCRRRNLYKVKPLVGRDFKRFSAGHNAEHIAVRTDNPYFGVTDLLVDLRGFIGFYKIILLARCALKYEK